MRVTRQAALAPAVIVIAVIVAIVVVLVSRPAGTTQAQGTVISTARTGWVLPRLGGAGTVSLSDFRGRPLVLTFFASWCTACRDELPQFLAVSRRLRGVAFAGVNSEEYGDGLAMARQYGVTAWPLAVDSGGSQASGLHDALTSAPGMPITAFYSAGGSVLRVHVGAQTGDELAAQIQELYGIRAA